MRNEILQTGNNIAIGCKRLLVGTAFNKTKATTKFVFDMLALKCVCTP